MGAVPDVEHASADVSTLAGRLADVRRRSFVGRERELELFRSALRADVPPFAVLFLHGPGGIGKTALLHRFVDDASVAGVMPILIDGRSIGVEATDLTAQVADGLGLPPGTDPLSALHAGPRVLLLIDAYEAVEALDRWLRERFLPDLPSRTLVVVAGRRAPNAAWREDAGWHELVEVVGLRNLEPHHARALLADRGFSSDVQDRIASMTGGHPLALSLVADVVAQSGEVPDDLSYSPDVIDALLARFVDDVPTSAHQDALSICAQALATTEALLRDALPDSDAGQLLAWLTGLSFIERGRNGMYPHDLARDVLEIDHRWRDEDRFRRLRRGIGRHLIARLTSAAPSERNVIIREVEFLNRHHPGFRPYLDWRSSEAVTVRGLRPGDEPVVAALAQRYCGPSSARIAAYWASTRPEAFLICERAGSDVVSGFGVLADLGVPSRHDLDADPVLKAVWRWIRAHGPLRADEHWLLYRMLVAPGSGEPLTPESDIVRSRMAVRCNSDPPLAWSVSVVPEPFLEFWEPHQYYLDHPRAEGAEVVVDGTRQSAFAHDWRAVPLAAWHQLMGQQQFDPDPEQLSRSRQPPLAVLSAGEFADAVKDALRNATKPNALDSNPLSRSRVVAMSGDGTTAGGQALADLLEQAVDALRGDSRGDKAHRALATTYYKGAPTQEMAAERLGLPFSTYRRHLTTGIDELVASLWERELHGAPAA